MYLGDGSGCDRFLVETAETALDGPANGVFDQRPHGLERKRWNPVLQASERLDPFRIKQIAAHREDLAELDGNRADVAQQRDDRLRAGAVERLVSAAS